MSDDAPINKLVVGLGNPGTKYDGTRHNVGFEVLNCLSRKLGATFPKAKFEGQYTRVSVAGASLTMLWPLTFMNSSGRCVSATAKFFNIATERDLLVVCDDLSLPLGKLRMRSKGSAGGQKGLDDILRSLGTQSIARLRIGIETPPPQWDAAAYVLSRFREDERPVVSHAIAEASEAVLLWCDQGIEYCMNRIN